MAELREGNLACVGDLMAVYDGGGLPELHRTNVIDAVAYRFGGNALNFACHLSSLGRRPVFIAACGDREFSDLGDFC